MFSPILYVTVNPTSAMCVNMSQAFNVSLYIINCDVFNMSPLFNA